MESGIDRKLLSAAACFTAAAFCCWLVLSPFRYLPFLRKYAIYFGNNPTIHILIIIAAFLYLHLYITKPELAKRNAKDSLTTVGDLIIYVLAALFIAGAAVNLYPTESLAGTLGDQAGILALFAGIAIGCVLPACPFISYPIIGGLYTAGAGFLGVMGMLFGSGLGFVCVISADLAFFDSKIMSLRILLTLTSAITAGVLVYLSGIKI